MKWLLAIAVSFLVIAGKAQSLDQAGNWVLLSYHNGITNSVPASVTNVYAANATYHTFQFTATNSCSYAIDATADGTNYLLGATNALTIGVTSEATLTKKEKAFRIRLLGTNVGCSFSYRGQ